MEPKYCWCPLYFNILFSLPSSDFTTTEISLFTAAGLGEWIHSFSQLWNLGFDWRLQASRLKSKWCQGHNDCCFSGTDVLDLLTLVLPREGFFMLSVAFFPPKIIRQHFETRISLWRDLTIWTQTTKVFLCLIKVIEDPQKNWIHVLFLAAKFFKAFHQSSRFCRIR